MTIARFTSSFEISSPHKLEALTHKIEQTLSLIPPTSCYPKLVLEDRAYMHISDLEKNTLWRYSLPPLDRVLLGTSGGKDYYEILGCARHDINLKRIYYNLALTLHPDKNQEAGLTEEQKRRWKDIQEAWGVLKDLRRAYDRCLLEGERTSKAQSSSMHESLNLSEGIQAEDEVRSCESRSGVYRRSPFHLIKRFFYTQLITSFTACITHCSLILGWKSLSRLRVEV